MRKSSYIQSIEDVQVGVVSSKEDIAHQSTQALEEDTRRVKNKIIAAQNTYLTETFTKKEVEQDLKQIAPLKS